MSQQINLYNPALRKRREWLSLPVIAVVTGLVLLVEVAAAAWQGWERADVQSRLAGMQSQLRLLQEEVQTIARVVAERQSDPALAKEIERANEALRQREEVFKALETAAADSGNGFSGYFMAFARQTMDGLWLTGFTINSRTLEIRGRALDGALLPTYIRRLDAERNFQGRKFAALEMKGVEPKPTDSAAAKPAVKPARPYVEFLLQGVGAPAAKDGQ